jgi:putative glutamine amidotransferase
MSAPTNNRLKIGISACFFHADANRPIFTGKTLQYVEQSIVHWVQSAGAIAFVIPSPAGTTQRGDVQLAHYAELLRDDDQKISRPMQWYTGVDARDYVPLNKR